MLDQLCQLAQSLQKLPHEPDQELLNDVVEGLRDAWLTQAKVQLELAALASADVNDATSVVPILVRLHLLLDGLNTPLLDLHDELKRLIAAYPQLEE
ncbi:MAG: hypothetical protein AMXMBFR33_30060 [Candidatus Xenobia bacterium]|jgi:hypothetical protein